MKVLQMKLLKRPLFMLVFQMSEDIIKINKIRMIQIDYSV